MTVKEKIRANRNAVIVGGMGSASFGAVVASFMAANTVAPLIGGLVGMGVGGTIVKLSQRPVAAKSIPVEVKSKGDGAIPS